MRETRSKVSKINENSCFFFRRISKNLKQKAEPVDNSKSYSNPKNQDIIVIIRFFFLPQLHILYTTVSIDYKDYIE